MRPEPSNGSIIREGYRNKAGSGKILLLLCLIFVQINCTQKYVV